MTLCASSMICCNRSVEVFLGTAFRPFRLPVQAGESCHLWNLWGEGDGELHLSGKVSLADDSEGDEACERFLRLLSKSVGQSHSVPLCLSDSLQILQFFRHFSLCPWLAISTSPFFRQVWDLDWSAVSAAQKDQKASTSSEPAKGETT